MAYAQMSLQPDNYKICQLPGVPAGEEIVAGNDNMTISSTAGKKRSLLDCVIGRNATEAEAGHDEVSPFLVEFFMVQGVGFKCMAYMGFDGKWHGAFDNRVLPGNIRVLG
jgi:hypothetical protein